MPFKALEALMYDLLEGGSIKRYHMKSTIKEQQVAAHSWRMAAIIHSIWPDCRKELVMATLFHDVSERVTGDVASPVKWANPEVAEALNRLTTNEELRLGIRFPLEVEEQHLLAWVDKIEGCLFCLDEIQMGNRKLCKTFARYYKASCDPKFTEAVYAQRVDRMKWMQDHLRLRAEDLGIPVEA